MNIRDKITNVSSDLFLKHGLRSVSIDDICNRLRISKKTFYSTFSQKEELIEELLASVRSGKIGSLKKRAYDDDSANCIDKLLKCSGYFNDKHDEKIENIFFDLKKYYPDILQKHMDAMDVTMVDVVKTNLKTGIDERLYRQEIDVDAMAILITTVKGSPIGNLKQFRKFSSPQAIEFLIDSFIRMLLSEDGLKYYLEVKQNKEKEKIK